MSTNNYFYLCCNELLKQIINFKNNLNNNQVFKANSNVDISWVLISTSLLLSENLLKKENIYNLLNNKQFTMIENILEKNMTDIDYQKLESYFLDDNNQIVNPLHNLTADLEELNEYLVEKDIKQYKNHGSNKAIISNNKIDYKKLIIRIRNSIAHSNYETIDENYLRLFHYDETTNELDFNVKINKIIVLTVIDELNEIVAKKYKQFLNEYYVRDEEIQFSETSLEDNKIIEFLLKYDFLSKDECKEILEEAKKDKKFYPNYERENNYNKFSVIYELIYQKIKPVCDYGIILNEIIYDMCKKNSNLENYFYEKFGYYDYFQSELFESSDYENKKSLEENKFKILFLSFLNSFLLYNYNSNNIVDYSKINFSKIEIDQEIKTKYINQRYKNIKSSFEKLLKQEKELRKISDSLKNLQTQLKVGKNKNNFLSNVLPERINNLIIKYKEEFEKYTILKSETQQEMYNKLFEITDMQDNVNLNNNLSRYIINHLRNSLAHGYVYFPEGINLDNIYETIICFEDYEKMNKENITFKATIKIRELIGILTDKKIIDNTFYSSMTDNEIKKVTSKK